MDIIIEKASEKYLYDCEMALSKSTLGEKYFSSNGSAKKAILEGMSQENLYIALCEKECVGFFYIIPNGAFHAFPYLHILSIKEEYRGKGIGQCLLKLVEKIAFEYADKIFLVVADFNPEAKRFYENNGYYQVGEIPSLYRQGINEYIMMKEKDMKVVK